MHGADIMNEASTMAGDNSQNTKRTEAEIVREYVPIDDKQIHGVTFDGKLVWFARDRPSNGLLA